MTDPVASPRTAAVVVTHDTRDEVLACLPTLVGAGADELVVVDSGSSDGTADAVRAAFPDVEVVELPNVGFGRAANVGVLRTSAPYVLIANADTRFDAAALGALAATLDSEPDVGVIGPLVRYPDGRLQASARRLPTLGEAVAHGALGHVWETNPWSRRYRREDEDPTTAADVDWVSGCALAVRRRAFEEVGGFDPRYFLFVEDVDLCWRLRDAGWRVRFCPDAEVLHTVGLSSRERPARTVIEHARSLDRFYGIAYASGLGRVLRPAVRVGIAVWAGLMIAVRRRRRERA